MKSKYNYKYSKVSQHNYIRNVLPSAIQYPIDHNMIRKKVPWSLVDHSRLTICTNTTILQVAWVRMPLFTFFAKHHIIRSHYRTHYMYVLMWIHDTRCHFSSTENRVYGIWCQIEGEHRWLRSTKHSFFNSCMRNTTERVE